MRILILVEGQTEEQFVKRILAPAFLHIGLYFIPTLLVTKVVKNGPNFKGGVSSYAKFASDMRRLLSGGADAIVTTLLDYYGLPSDFPGMSSRPRGSPTSRVKHVEAAIHARFGAPPNLIPFLALHEFEAFLYSDVSVLPVVMTQSERQSDLAAILSCVSGPEDIDERPDKAPSKRIIRLFPQYKKSVHGPIAATRIGLDRIRSECPHFSEWLSRLERYA